MTISMPGPGARHGGTPPTTGRAPTAARLQALLDIPFELFDGVPGASSGRARDLRDVGPCLAVRARALKDVVMRGRTPDLDTVPILLSTPDGFTVDAFDRAV